MTAEPPPDVRRLSTGKKAVFALATLAAFFLVIEVALAVIGFPGDRIVDDPYVGFTGALPLMQASVGPDGDAVMTTAPGKLRLFNQQWFKTPKPAGTRRVFCVGGSTTYGRPFDDATSYSGYLRRLLPQVDPSSDWEVINAGGVSYASYRVAAVMEELADYQPDLFIVYTAHNEFLERRTYASIFATPDWQQSIGSMVRSTRTFAAIDAFVDLIATKQAPADGAVGDDGLAPPLADDDRGIEMLPGEVDERLNHTVGPSDYERDDAWQAAVVTHYEANLNRMVQIARSAGAAIVFVEPASNEKDCAPFKNQDSFFDDATQRFADGQYDDAQSLFAKAIDRDVCPLRATTAISKAIADVAEDQQVPVVPFARRLRQQCVEDWGHSCLGKEYFLDHVHPNIDTHRDLAVWIIETLVQSEWMDGTAPAAEVVAAVDQAIHQSLDPQHQGVAFRNLAKVMHWSGKFPEASRHAEDALRLLPGDPESQFVLADSLVRMGLIDLAIDRYQRLMDQQLYEPALLRFAVLLADTGRLDQAKPYTLMATAAAKSSTRRSALQLLVRIHTALGEDQQADEAVRQMRAEGTSADASGY
ncbi:tetratricopeptide repeat protein [Rubripirellula lacrimiformis]|uniref:O-GlcNAc transferase n=1 Tax=Rubripirellula lacrimiformis TaxID=1930273 RepID=UPI00119D7EC3|nr:O-GlcNAc transferase [Rubripirellula lacrimiformis]